MFNESGVSEISRQANEQRTRRMGELTTKIEHILGVQWNAGTNEFAFQMNVLH